MNFKVITCNQRRKEMFRLHSAGKSRRDDTLLTVGFNLRKQSDQLHAKSRRDDTLLTVGFNLRKQSDQLHTKSRRDDTCIVKPNIL